MDIWARFQPMTAKTAEAVFTYLEVHLKGTKERVQVPPGAVHNPRMLRPNLWRLAGWDGNPSGPTPELLTALLAGRDGEGQKLTCARSEFRPPTEFVFSLHAEVSQGLHILGPQAMDRVLGAVQLKAIEMIEMACVRVQERGAPSWKPAGCLTLDVLHHLNRRGDPHGHGHSLIPPPALDWADRWRTFDNGKATHSLSKLIRPALTDVMVQACAEIGVTVILHRGVAREEGRYPSGAEVRLPSGLVIPAGSLSRPRSADIRADRECKAALGTTPLTTRERIWVMSSPGCQPAEMPKPSSRAGFCAKLGKLGLLDPDTGRIKDAQQLQDSMVSIAQSMAMAQVQLEAFRHLPGERLSAARQVAEKRIGLCSSLGRDPELDRQVAADAWVVHAVEALGSLARKPCQPASQDEPHPDPL
jgi:hypothetical protein